MKRETNPPPMGPRPPAPPNPPRPDDPRQHLRDAACVAYFLLGARDQMWNGHTGREALSAFCRLTDIDEAQLILKLQGFS